MAIGFISRSTPRFTCALLRHSSTTPEAPSLKLVAELRKRTTATIQKAREALIASNGDVSGAMKWLEKDRGTTGRRKAEKVGGRFAGEGLVSISVLSRGTGNASEDSLGVRASMIELNCETDFVGRNELFRVLARDVAFTAAFISDPVPTLRADEAPHFLQPIELSHLRDAPLMIRGQDISRHTVAEAIRDTIAAVGENISIRRAVSFVHSHIPPTSGVGLRVSSYAHGALVAPPNSSPAIMDAQGKLGALVAIGLRTSPASRLGELLETSTFSSEMGILERALARQIVGLRPEGVRGETEEALYNQTFDMLASSGGQSVETVLKTWSKERCMVEKDQEQRDDVTGLAVVEFSRWEVGEGL